MGTQVGADCRYLGITALPKISTGDMLRDAVSPLAIQLGREVKETWWRAGTW